MKVAVIGFGYIGRKHADIISNIEGLELTAVVDVDYSKLEKARRLYETEVYTSISELLDNEDIDTMHICTPNGLHYIQVKEALLNKVNVLCEKPMSLSYEHTRELIELAQKNGLYFESVLQNRLSPTAQLLKRLIEENEIKPFYVKTDCFWNRDRNYYASNPWRGTFDLDGGVLYTQFSHFIDILVWLFGELKPTQVNLWNFNHKYLGENWWDSGNILFETEKQIQGNFNFSTSCYKQNLESSITIIGHKGTIKVGGQYMEKLLHYNVNGNSVKPKLAKPQVNQYPQWQGSANNHEEFIRLFYQKIFEQEPPSYENIENASLGIKFIETVYSWKRDFVVEKNS